jgi:hypothetical protein
MCSLYSVSPDDDHPTASSPEFDDSDSEESEDLGLYLESESCLSCRRLGKENRELNEKLGRIQRTLFIRGKQNQVILFWEFL